MKALIISLLLANIVTIISVATYIGKELVANRKQLEQAQAILECQLEDCIEAVESDTATEELKEELKEHISKEFMAMSFRGFKLMK